MMSNCKPFHFTLPASRVATPRGLLHAANVTKQSAPRSGPANFPVMRGFTLMEVLVALGIFALGFVAIASVFPVGIALQKQTTNAVLARHVGQNAEAMLTARALDYKSLGAEGTDTSIYNSAGTNGQYFDTATDEYPPYDAAKTPAGIEDRVKGLTWNDPENTSEELIARWSILDRSSPSVVSAAADRDIFWVPLIQHTTGLPANVNSWNLFVFVLDNTGDGYTNYYDDNEGNPNDGSVAGVPAVEWFPATVDPDNTAIVTLDLSAETNSTTLGLSAGDLVLDCNGIEYTVLDATGNQLVLSFAVIGEPEYFWVVRPSTPGDGSPLLDIHGPFGFTPSQ